MTNSFAISFVHLRVRDLERALDFYIRQVGFVLRERTPTSADLAPAADATSLLRLSVTQGAAAAPADAAGLFHAALLLPSRAQLGAWLRGAAAAGVSFAGFSDHGVSEAIYFSDPDGNGLEFYSDRPPESWPRRDDRGVAMTTLPLDIPNLLAAGAKLDPATSLHGARWGHLHFSVQDVEKSAAFFQEALALDEMQRFGNSARFLARDGYHHHIGLNTWSGARRPHAADKLGLVSATLRDPGRVGRVTLQDPDDLRVEVEPG